MNDKLITMLCAIILLLGAAIFTIQNEDAEEDVNVDEGSDEPMLDATKAYLGSGKNSMITANALYANLNDGYTGNDPFLLSVRTAEQYEKGHIPGAVNIPWTRVFTEENISKIPTNKQIVVYCFTGHTASQVTALLNIEGYDAMCLKWGMCSWTTNSTVAPSCYNQTNDAHDFPVVTGESPGTWDEGTIITTRSVKCGGDPAPTPTETDTSVDTGDADLRATIDAYLSSGKPAAIKATDLYDNLNDGDTSNDPFILSIRSAEQYAKGHIPGAINIGFTSLFTDENIAKLPTDGTQIVVVCYTGHTASQAAALLNVNGYNAVPLKWAMTSWSTNPEIAPSGYDKSTAASNYPVIIGAEAGTLTDGVIVGPPVPVADENAVIDGTRAYLGSGKSSMITADALYANLNDGYTGNDPFILSVRDAAKYAEGHIPGAVNIPWRNVFTEENISKLPSNKQIVVYCYTGHTASQVTSMLNTLGYDAVCLKWGMCSWTSDTTIAPSCYDPETAAMDYPVTTGTSPGVWTRSGTRDCGDGDGGGTIEEPVEQGSTFDTIRVACNNYLAEGKAPAVSSSSLYTTLTDGNASNDPFLLSIRSASQYEIGHITGAVNIGFSSLFNEENLVQLPTDQQIVVVCYTGHTASQATSLLNINGYDAIALKWGMTSWSSDPTIAPSAYNRSKDVRNYPVIIGNESGALADGVIADTRSVVLDATNTFLGAGKSTQIKAEDLYANLNDGSTSNDPFILSVRSESQYAKGHIPGAICIPWRSVFTEENISKLPTNKQIVVYCYTGHTASQVTSMLNTVGFDALCLKFGMSSWTTNTTVAPSYYDPETVPAGLPVVTGSDPGTWTRGDTREGCDTGDGGGTVEAVGGDTFDIVRSYCNNYLSEGKPATLSASSLNVTMTDGNVSNDPFILSIRSASQYAIGHIPGAVNIGMSSLFTEENMALLPTDKQIVVVCYTGHTASQTTSLLNINGYDAVALKYGMTGWSTDPTIAPAAYDRDTSAHNYPVVIDDEPGAIADGVIADTRSVVLESTNAFLEAGKSTMITAKALQANLNDDFASNDPFILSVRSESQYAIGHIPGAVNIPWREVFTEENLAKLPTNKQIVVYCYTGHTASQVTSMLNTLGYDAVCLKFGMTSWTKNTTIAPGGYDPTSVTNDLPVVTGTDPGLWTRGGTRDCGDGDGGGTVEAVSGDTFDIVRGYCNNYLAEGKAPAMSASSLNTTMTDGNVSNDPFILSIRKADQYALGHIPGAVNIGMSSLFTKENMALLPTDQQIVVVCYTGHTASQTTALLNINGYDAVALKFGMCSWTNDTVVNAGICFDPSTDANNFRVSTGSGPGEWATALPAA